MNGNKKTVGFTKIPKQIAVDMHYIDNEVYVLPCNFHTGNIWQTPMLVPSVTQLIEADITLNQWLAIYKHYNCDKERGKKVNFYKKTVHKELKEEKK